MSMLKVRLAGNLLLKILSPLTLYCSKWSSQLPEVWTADFIPKSAVSFLTLQYGQSSGEDAKEE
jgi:hypothetical protein